MQRNSSIVLTTVAYAAAALACKDVRGPPTTTVEADSADQIAFGISHTISTDGMRRVLIEADTGYNYDARQTTELRQLTVIFYSPQGGETSRITVTGAFTTTVPAT